MSGAPTAGLPRQIAGAPASARDDRFDVAVPTTEQRSIAAGWLLLGVAALIGAGVFSILLVLGLFTPVAAAGALAFLINGLLATVSARPHSHTFPYFLPDGHEYQITLIVLAVAVILCGPGRYGLDAGRGWAHRPFIGSFVALLAGIAAGIGVWVLLNGVNPIA